MPNSTLVDLVKIIITNTGTGSLSLGGAVLGFRGVEALTDGDVYSYSIQQGANFEVGQGTYNAGVGTLSRGVEVSSYGGTPIALAPNAVVAFPALARDFAVPGPPGPPGPEGAPGGSLYLTRADAVAADIDSSILSIETTGFAVAGDGGGARYVRVASDPSVGAGGFQSADGGWWRYVVQGPMYPEQFGGKADLDIASFYGPITGTPTDNLPVFNDMLLQLVYGVYADYKMVPIFQFGAGGYYFSAQLEPRKIVYVKGMGGGTNNLSGTIFRFPANCCGVVTNNRATGGGGIITPGTEGTSEGSTFSDIYFIGGNSNNGEGTPGGNDGIDGDRTKHGFWMRAYAKVIRCSFDWFPGHGIAIIAYNDDIDPAKVGNANGWYLDRCIVRKTGGDGIHVQGIDANAGTAVCCEVTGAGNGGIVDLSGLGNAYINPQIDSWNTGIADGLPGGHVYNNGYYYNLTVANDDDIGGATEPGTNEQVWYPVGTGDAPTTGQPQWVEGNTYRIGLPIYATGDSNRTEFFGYYTEGGISDIASASAIAFGGQGQFTRGSRAFTPVTTASNATYNNTGAGGYRNLSYSAELYPYYGIYQSSAVGSVVGRGASNYFNYWEHGCDWDGGNMVLQQDYAGNFYYNKGGIGSGNRNVYRVTGTRTIVNYGRPVPSPFMFDLPGFALTSATDPTLGRLITIAAALPTTGTYAAGERVINASPALGGPDEWVCTQTGSITTASWAANTYHAIGDIVNNGGSCYISTRATNWAASTVYANGDMASNYGLNYICLVGGTSGAYGPNGFAPPIDGTVTWAHPSGGLFTAWAPTTAYIDGQLVSNNNLNYQCTLDGTSGSSGGPTGYGSGIVDGTAEWAFVGISSVTGNSGGPSGTGHHIIDGTIVWNFQQPFVLTPKQIGSQVIGMSAVAASHTGDTTETNLATITVPAGAMGANGRIEVEMLVSYPNSANNKNFRVYFGGTAFLSATPSTSAAARYSTAINNRNATNTQVGGVLGGGIGAGSSAVTTTAVDTTADVIILITGELGNAGETITLESYIVKLIPQA